MISLFGYGKTTKAIAKKLDNCQAFDDKFIYKDSDESTILLPPSHFEASKSQVEIPSPGFPPNHELIQKAQNIQSEYDFFYKDMPNSVWITGTNGKTTTTQMCTHLLKANGALAGGNIGEPLANLDSNAPLWLLETSSFTLHYTKIAKPEILIILPIKDDHISWHGSFKSYEQSKLSPMDRMSEGDVVILPAKYKEYPTMAMKITYEDEYDLAQKMELDILKVSFKTPFLMDAIMALCIQKILYNKVDYELINTFRTDAHKLEEFSDRDGRIWVNDTKGTNVDATIEALKRYAKEEILIILGGDDKGAPLNELFETMQSLHVKIFAIGSNTDKIVEYAKDINKEVHACYELSKAIELIKPLHTKDTIALLSPAAASLDQFSSYIARGELFKTLALTN